MEADMDPVAVNNIDRKIVIVDGGFGTQIMNHVQQPKIDNDALWSCRFLATNPEAIINTHLDFLRAGADLVISNTYQASIELFVKHLHISEKESYELIKTAVKLAKTAVDRYKEEFPNERTPKVVGSVGPYGAALHDGSEYNGTYAKTTPVNVMREYHIPRIKALIEAGVDMLAIETIPCRAEAEMLVLLLKEFPGVKAWLTFSVDTDGKSISNGDNFQQTARACYDLNPDQLVAVGINCTSPRLIESFLLGINDNRSKPIPLIVYPNNGDKYNADEGWTELDKCEPVETFVAKWLDMGVTWVGGCCRTYAKDIAKIRQEVYKWLDNKKK